MIFFFERFQEYEYNIDSFHKHDEYKLMSRQHFEIKFELPVILWF